MTVANQDFDVDEGSHRTLVVPLTANGAPYEVPVGSVLEWWASPSQFDASASVPIKKSSTSGNVSFVTASGQSTLYVTLGPGDTAGRGQKKLFHQAWITRPDTVELPLFSGTMTVVKRLVA
jgi:hypothetical protein